MNRKALDILVVDDSASTRFLATSILARLGYGEVREAVDGSAALAALAEKPASLVICDIEMAPMGGLAFLEALRGHRMVGLRETPVAFLTAHSESHVIDRARTLNADGFIVKPFSAEILDHNIKSVMRRRGIELSP
ncbi:MAG: response regulator [Alphaproteobacteria bacterium]|nr:response regulator [Alphaproteobacteria bacterium]